MIPWRRCLLGLIVADADPVLQQADVKQKAPASFRDGLHPQEHAPHVRMLDDRNPRGILAGCLKMPPLDPLPGVVEGVQEGCGGASQRLHAHVQAGLVHHHEHGAHALVFLAQQGSEASAPGAQGHGAGGAAVDAHLLLDAGADDVVGLAQAPVVIDPDLGDEEKRYSGGAGRRALDPRQHRVDDVFRRGPAPRWR